MCVGVVMVHCYPPKKGCEKGDNVISRLYGN